MLVIIHFAKQKLKRIKRAFSYIFSHELSKFCTVDLSQMILIEIHSESLIK